MQIFLQRFGEYSDQSWYVWLLVVVGQALGSLAMLSLLADPARPTVGQAIATGLRRLPSYLAGSLVIVAMCLSVLFMAAFLGALLGSSSLATVLLVPGFLGAFYIAARFALLAPVVQLESVANPIAALSRAAQLTAPTSWQVLGFLFLVFIAVRLITWLVSAGLVIVVALLGNAEATDIAESFLTAVSQAIVIAVLTAVLARLHRHLSLAA